MDRLSKKFLPFGILALILLIVVGLFVFRPKTQPVDAPQKAWPIHIVQIKKVDVHPNLLLYGDIQSPKTSTLKSAVIAYVEKTPFLVGSKVKAGQVVVYLDPRDATIALKTREADVKNLDARIRVEKVRYLKDKKAFESEKILVAIGKRNVQRHEILSKKNLTAKATLDDARDKLHRQLLLLSARELALEGHKHRFDQLVAQLDRAKALLDQAKLDLSRTKVKAPFSGRIISLNVSVGDRVQANTELAKMYDDSNIELRAQIPSKYLSGIQIDLTKGVKLKATAVYNNLSFDLQLLRLGGQRQESRGGVDGFFKVLNNSQALALGSALELVLQLPVVKDVYVVPATAVYQANSVYKVEKNRLLRVPVVIKGERVQDRAQHFLVTGPKLQPGDAVMTSKISNAITGLKVQILKP